MDCIQLRLSAATTSIVIRDNWLVIESSNPSEMEDGLRSATGNKLLSVTEISQQTGFTTGAVRGWLKAGKLVGARVGKEYRVKESDLSTFLKGNQQTTELRIPGFRRRRKIDPDSL